MQTVAQKIIVKGPVKFLALGDSYTIGESVSQKERWPEQLITELTTRGLACDHPTIIATTGWRTDDLMKAIRNANLKPPYNLVSLLIGVNNYYQGKSEKDYASEFEELLTTAISLAGGNHARVFVLSIPDYGFTPFGEPRQAAISNGIDAFNAVNESIAKKYNVTYISITAISRRGLQEPELVAEDKLHPSGKMYAEWVTLIQKNITISN